MGEFGVALMIGGSIPGETRVASIAIFEHTEMLDYGAAGLLCLVLMIVSYGALLIIGRPVDPMRRVSKPIGKRTKTTCHCPPREATLEARG